MAFFRDRAVNLLNLHYGIHSIALSGGGAFFAVYLLKAGVSLPWVLASLSLILAGRLLIRPRHSGHAALSCRWLDRRRLSLRLADCAFPFVAPKLRRLWR